MPLTYDFKKVADNKNLTEKELVKLNYLIYMTIPVGMSEITSDNYTEFDKRLNLLEVIRGTQDLTTTKQVKRLIGLKTNASTKTRHQFMKFVEQVHFNQ